MRWDHAIEMLRKKAETERYRLASLRGLRGWREFVVAWSQTAGGVPAHIRSQAAPKAVQTDLDGLLAWVWDSAHPWPDLALAAADARLPFGSFQTMTLFIALRGAGLIFPDGSVAKPAMDRVDRFETLKDLSDALSHQDRIEALNAGVARAKAAQASPATAGEGENA